MRRLLGLAALIGLGVLVGFVVRLIWPRNGAIDDAVYPGPQPSDVSAERRT